MCFCNIMTIIILAFVDEAGLAATLAGMLDDRGTIAPAGTGSDAPAGPVAGLAAV